MMTATIDAGTTIMIMFVELFSFPSFFSVLLFVVAVAIVVSRGFTCITVVVGGGFFGVCVVAVSGT